MLCNKYFYVSLRFYKVQAIILFHLTVGEIQSLHDGWTVGERVITQIPKLVTGQGELRYPFQLSFQQLAQFDKRGGVEMHGREIDTPSMDIAVF